MFSFLKLRKKNEPVFHADWESRVYALVRVWYPWARYKSWGSFRHNLEKIPPSDYLEMSYYERWFHVHEQKALETGIVTRTELETSQANLDNVVPDLGNPTRKTKFSSFEYSNFLVIIFKLKLV